MEEKTKEMLNKLLSSYKINVNDALLRRGR